MKSMLLALSLMLFSAFNFVHAGDAVWIDVRSAAEFSTGAVEGAVNIPHDEIADKIATVTTDKDAQINLYCRSGRRAGWAKDSLAELGYKNVINHGGYSDVMKAAK